MQMQNVLQAQEDLDLSEEITNYKYLSLPASIMSFNETVCQCNEVVSTAFWFCLLCLLQFVDVADRIVGSQCSHA